MAVNDDELSAMAIEELDAACGLSWPELTRITPWGDSFTGFAPSGREVEIERRYIGPMTRRARCASRWRCATPAPARAPRPAPP